MARVGEPILLTTYDVSVRAASKSKHVFAHGSTDAVTLTVQGDGVHVFNPSTIHTVASYSLGPSSSFSCPAVSRQASGKSKALSTLAALDSQKGQSELRAWSTAPDDKGEGPSQTGQSQKIQTSIHSLHAYSAQRTLLITTDGDIQVLDSSLNSVAQSAAQDRPDATRTRKAFVFTDAAGCAFLPASVKSRAAAVVVMMLAEGERLMLELSIVSSDDTIEGLGATNLEYRSQDVQGVSLSESGHFSVLLQSGSWSLHTLTLSPNSFILSPASRTISLSPSALHVSQSALLSLGSSHILLAAPSGSTIVLLLWDLQFGVVLSHTSRAMPASLTSIAGEPGGVDLDLVRCGNERLAFIAGPRSTEGSKTGTRTKTPNSARVTVFVVPCTVPARSSIGAALGRATASAKWLVDSSSVDPSPSAPVPTSDTPLAIAPGDTYRAALEALQSQMLTALEVAMQQSNASGVEKVFEDWLNEEEQLVRARWVAKGTRSNKEIRKVRRGEAPKAAKKDRDGDVEMDDVTLVEKDEEEPESVQKKEDKKEVKIALNEQEAEHYQKYLWKEAKKSVFTTMHYNVVARVLELILPPLAHPAPSADNLAPYPSKIVATLLKREAVASSMITSGIIPALESRNDWDNITLALTDVCVQDIPEAHLIGLLKGSVDRTRAERTKETQPLSSPYPLIGKPPRANAMLSLIMQYPTSAPAMRAALRAQLRAAEDVAVLLPILTGWIGQWCVTEDLDALAVGGSAGKKGEMRAATERFQERVTFLTTLLDASFVSIIQDPALNKVLRRLHETLTPQLQVQEMVETLRGPLERFVRHKAVEEERARKEADVGTGRASWQKARPAPTDRVVGVYQVERLTLS